MWFDHTSDLVEADAAASFVLAHLCKQNLKILGSWNCKWFIFKRKSGFLVLHYLLCTPLILRSTFAMDILFGWTDGGEGLEHSYKNWPVWLGSQNEAGLFWPKIWPRIVYFTPILADFHPESMKTRISWFRQGDGETGWGGSLGMGCERLGTG